MQTAAATDGYNVRCEWARPAGPNRAKPTDAPLKGNRHDDRCWSAPRRWVGDNYRHTQLFSTASAQTRSNVVVQLAGRQTIQAIKQQTLGVASTRSIQSTPDCSLFTYTTRVRVYVYVYAHVYKHKRCSSMRIVVNVNMCTLRSAVELSTGRKWKSTSEQRTENAE